MTVRKIKTDDLLKSQYTGAFNSTEHRGSKIKTDFPICKKCRLPIARWEHLTQTDEGAMHDHCARKIIAENLSQADLPRPTQFNFEKYFTEQLTNIINTPPSKKVERQIKTIFDLSEFLLSPIDTSKFGPHNDMTTK